MFRNLFALADRKNRFIYELDPEIFGPSLTVMEIEGWIMYYNEQAEKHNRMVEGIRKKHGRV